MPRNSQGNYTLPAGNPVQTETIIEADAWANPTMEDIAAEMTDSLSRQGKGSMTAELGVVDGTENLPGVRFVDEVDSGIFRSGVADWGLVVIGSRVLQLLSTAVNFFLPVNITGALGITGNLKVTGDAEVTGSLGVGTDTTLSKFHVKTDVNSNTTLESTVAGGAAGPLLTLWRNSNSPIDVDKLGRVVWEGNSDDGVGGVTSLNVAYAQLDVEALDTSDALESGEYRFFTRQAGAIASRMKLGAGLHMAGVTGGDPGAGVINATGYQENGVPLVSNLGKNVIINSDFEIWQRGFTFAGLPGNAAVHHTVDRFSYQGRNSAVMTLRQLAEAPTVAESGHFSSFCLESIPTTADGTVAANDFAQEIYVIEGYDWATIAQQPFTVSFWVKAIKTGIFCISLRNVGVDRSYVAEYTINVANTWEYKTITVAASPAAGTWDYENLVGATFGFCLMAGTDFHTTPDAWQTGNFLSTVNQVNGLDSTSNFFRVSQFKIELGSVATPFVRAGDSIGNELALCHRYLYREASTNNLNHVFVMGQAISTTQARGPFHYPTTMRAPPIMTFSTAGTFAINTATGGQSGGVTLSGTAITEYGFEFNVLPSGNLIAGNASALRANNVTTAFINADAEF